jgi:hypothetical protein
MRVTAEDLQEIHNLKARYLRSVDSRDWRAIRQIFLADATFEGFAVPTVGVEGFIANVSAYLDGAVTVHQGFAPELTVVDDDVVRGIWAMHDEITWPPTARPSTYNGVDMTGMAGFRGYGHYLDEYVRTETGWRISFQRLTRLKVELVPEPGPVEVLSRTTAHRLDPAWLESGRA